MLPVVVQFLSCTTVVVFFFFYNHTITRWRVFLFLVLSFVASPRDDEVNDNCNNAGAAAAAATATVGGEIRPWEVLEGLPILQAVIAVVVVGGGSASLSFRSKKMLEFQVQVRNIKAHSTLTAFCIVSVHFSSNNYIILLHPFLHV